MAKNLKLLPNVCKCDFSCKSFPTVGQIWDHGGVWPKALLVFFDLKFALLAVSV